VNGFSKLRQLVADLQKSRPRAVRPADSFKLTWSDALDALRQANNEPSVSPWRAKPAKLTPKQALSLKIAHALFPDLKVLAKTKTAAIKRELDKNWKRFGGKGKPPDYKTIARALGRYI
jgi:hypothetical protein